MYAITLLKQRKQVGQELFANVADQANAALRVAHEWRERADEWLFEKVGKKGDE